MELKNLQHRDLTKTNSFEGVPILCASGVHEGIFNEFEKAINKDANILVLGSGSGAFEQRLLSNGYKNITSVEFNPEHYIPKNTNLLTTDLNSDFSNIGNFDAIVAIEIIEHIENQFNFIRCIKKNLKDNGVFFLSSPNCESTFSRLKYFITGEMHWFGNKELIETGHVTPIFTHILKFNLEQNNFYIEKHIGNMSVWNRALKSKKTINKFAGIFGYLITRIIKNINDFEINLFVIKNKK